MGFFLINHGMDDRGGVDDELHGGLSRPAGWSLRGTQGLAAGTRGNAKLQGGAIHVGCAYKSEGMRCAKHVRQDNVLPRLHADTQVHGEEQVGNRDG